jgi:hypothetical protein
MKRRWAGAEKEHATYLHYFKKIIIFIIIIIFIE